MQLLVNESIAGAFSRTIQADTDVSHDDLEVAFIRFNLAAGDLGRRDERGNPIGKHRRVKAVLSYAATNDPAGGGDLVMHLLGRLRGVGAFRAGSAQCLDRDVVENLSEVLRSEGFQLGDDGLVVPVVLDDLSGRELTEALSLYVRRARTGAADAALLAGTAKDLLEATARHILDEKSGGYNEKMPFPGTLLYAFHALGYPHISGAEHKILEQLSDNEIERLHQCLYMLALAVNQLRNEEGIGHGRPYLPSVGTRDAAIATEAMGLVAGFLLGEL